MTKEAFVEAVETLSQVQWPWDQLPETHQGHEVSHALAAIRAHVAAQDARIAELEKERNTLKEECEKNLAGWQKCRGGFAKVEAERRRLLELKDAAVGDLEKRYQPDRALKEIQIGIDVWLKKDSCAASYYAYGRELECYHVALKAKCAELVEESRLLRSRIETAEKVWLYGNDKGDWGGSRPFADPVPAELCMNQRVLLVHAVPVTKEE